MSCCLNKYNASFFKMHPGKNLEFAWNGEKNCGGPTVGDGKQMRASMQNKRATEPGK